MPHSFSYSSAPLYFSSTIRVIEREYADLPLMERAGLAATELACSIALDHGAPILVLAGPGNNGGDALVVARLLRERFYEVCVVFLGDENDDNDDNDQRALSPEAKSAWRVFRAAGGQSQTQIPEKPRWSLIVDGLFGIGLARNIGEPYSAIIRDANRLAARDGAPLLALDCPSGLNSDTGNCLGETIKATHTLSFIAAKPGLYTADGQDYCGKIAIAPLTLAPEKTAPPPGYLVSPALFAQQLKPRKNNSHKGLYGNAGLLGGSNGMIGALILAARAALRLGSGRVYASLLDKIAVPADFNQPELMFRAPDALLKTPLSVLACGPGLSTEADNAALLDASFALEIPLVLDAGALALLAAHKELRVRLATRRAPTILTPHPAEAARLLGRSVSEIQADRIAAANELAQQFHAFVALKGSGTVIASPAKSMASESFQSFEKSDDSKYSEHFGNAAWFINTSGNPGLASAGSGDVLTGMITALLAQRWPPLDALLAAVHVHGMAAEHLAAQGIGPIGLTAGEIIDAARYCFNSLSNKINTNYHENSA